MAFKMKNPSVMKMAKMAGNNRTAMKIKAEEAAAMKMKKAAMKLKEEAAMKAAKPDFPDIDGDGNTSESMKKAAADKKSGMKMKKESSMKMGHKSPAKLKKESPAKMGHSPKKMKKSAMKIGDPKKEMTQAEKDAAIANAMPAAKKETLSEETMAGMKSYFGGVNADIGAVKAKIKELKAKTERTGVSPKNQAKFDADLKAARRAAKARYPGKF